MLGRSGRESSRSRSTWGPDGGVLDGSRDGSTSRPGIGEFKSGRLVTPSKTNRNVDLSRSKVQSPPDQLGRLSSPSAAPRLMSLT